MRLPFTPPALLALALLLFGGGPLRAQTTDLSFTVSGIVTDQAGEPLIGVTVLLDGTSSGTVTDFDGIYTLSGRGQAGTQAVIFSYLGFGTQRREFTVDNANETISLDVELGTDALALDEIIVTGASVATSRRQLGNAISTLDNTALEETGAIAVDQALSGKIAGALVQQNSGDPAGGISVRLRGPSTINGSSDPLYIIDGIIVNNSSSNLVDLGGTSQNRLVDINPADIDRIEVIKGAAAAAIYGSRASNGVVQIFTKRGQSGAPRINFSTSLRVNELRKKIDVNEENLAWANPFDRADLTTVRTRRFDYQDEFFDTGLGTDNNLSVSGGSEKTKYFISGSYLNNEGIIKNTAFERFSGRLNLDQELSDWLSMSFGINFARSDSDDIPNGGIASSYGALTGFVFADNQIDPSPVDGIYPVVSPLVPRSNPLEAVDRFDFGSTTNRTITNVNFTAVPRENLTIKYLLGLDYANSSGTGFIPIGNTSSSPLGFSRRADNNALQYNNDLTLSYQADIGATVRSTTVAGGTWQYERAERIAIQTNEISPFISIASEGIFSEFGETRSEISYWGGFVQQTFGINDKLFLTGAVRLDGASVFGPDERNQLYAKASGSYVLSEEGFWKGNAGLSSAFNVFKLRASWGQAGNLTAIGAFQRFSNYNTLLFNGSNGAFPGTSLGNESIAPERQTEIEVGFDAAFINNRIGLEFTYYDQEVTDLLLDRELSPSTGFTTRVENIGTLRNTGIELALRATLVQNVDFSWDLTSTYASNDNEITSVVGDAQIVIPGSFSTNRVITGQPLGVFFRQFYARDDNGNILLDDDGYPFRGTTEDGQTSKVLGDPNPDWFGSLINEFSYRNFGLRIQLDAVQGFEVFNWNRRLLDNAIFGGGAGVGAELRGDQPKGFGGAQAGIFEEFVEDGSFVKLRELALNYSFSPKGSVVDRVRISLVGRNLISWDDYTGWDPEINTAGQNNGVRGFDFAGVPIPRTYQLGLNLSF